ncbi:MAG: hypothetical protein ABW185_12150 [Sedimenticola sp.]
MPLQITSFRRANLRLNSFYFLLVFTQLRIFPQNSKMGVSFAGLAQPGMEGHRANSDPKRGQETPRASSLASRVLILMNAELDIQAFLA